MSVDPIFHFIMPQLTALLKSQAEQNPSASYFNVDILKVISFQCRLDYTAGLLEWYLIQESYNQYYF